MREDARLKAVRLVGSGRVTVCSITGDTITATVRGDSARIYEVVLDPSGWRCPCDAASRRCSHVQAVQLVVLDPLRANVAPRPVANTPIVFDT